jgi:four helix bundle protein
MDADDTGETKPSKRITRHNELDVYVKAFEAAMEIFELTKAFPSEESYALTDQVRRSSRSVCANISEAWRRRRHKGNFLLRLNDAEAEAAETQTWLEFAVKCGYVEASTARPLYQTYDQIIGMLVKMIHHPQPWLKK